MHYEDLEIGQTFSTRPYRVEAAETLAFAERYDPRHKPEPRMVYLGGGPAASPWYVAAISSKLLAEWAEESDLVGAKVNDTVQDFDWLGGVLPSFTLRLQIEIVRLPESRNRFRKLGFPEVDVRVIANGPLGSSGRMGEDEDELVDQDALRYRTYLTVERRHEAPLRYDILTGGSGL